MRWPRQLFRRRPKDRWPEWRPDQILTPENRTITGYWNTNEAAMRLPVDTFGREHN